MLRRTIFKVKSIGLMESHFNSFRKNVMGQDSEFTTPYVRKKLIHADWIASNL